MVNFFLGYSGDGKTTNLISYSYSDISTTLKNKLIISDDEYILGNKQKIQKFSDMMGIRHLITPEITSEGILEEIATGHHLYIDTCSNDNFYKYFTVFNEIKDKVKLNRVLTIDAIRFHLYMKNRKLSMDSFDSLILTKCDLILDFEDQIHQVFESLSEIHDSVSLYMSMGMVVPTSLLRIDNKKLFLKEMKRIDKKN